MESIVYVYLLDVESEAEGAVGGFIIDILTY